MINAVFFSMVHPILFPAYAPFSLFEPVSSIIFGVLIMNEKLGVLQLVGCVIILASILFILICNNMKQKGAANENYV